MFNSIKINKENCQIGGKLHRSERKNTQKQRKELLNALVETYFPSPVKERVLDILKDENDSSLSCKQDYQRPAIEEAKKIVMTSIYEAKNKVTSWF